MNILTAIKKLMRLSVISKELTSQESEQLQLAISVLMIELIRADFIELQKEKNINARGHYCQYGFIRN